MTKSTQSSQLKFTKAMEINGVSPLPHYYEEIYTNQIGLKQLGIRGDKNYLFYSINGLGGGYYEETEKRLSADSVYDYFTKPGNRIRFFAGIDDVIAKLVAKTEEVNRLDLASLSVRKLTALFIEVNTLHGEIFTYYVVSQPYRMQRFEAKLRTELEKRVAGSRIDSYMTQLASSSAPTKITREEIDWLEFLIKYKTKYGSAKLDIANMEQERPEMYKDLIHHLNEYKILTLGDGNWDYNLQFYIDNLKTDYQKDLLTLQKRCAEVNGHEAKADAERKKLIDELYLDEETVGVMDFLAKVGHTRLEMRIEGWIPFVATIIKVDIALSSALKLGTKIVPLLNYMLPDELAHLAETGEAVPENELLERRGDNAEFLLLHDHGLFRIYYGSEARKKFSQLVPSIDHTATTELSGSTAVRGHIEGTVCVYQWGDNIAEKQKVIRRHPILVVGQTRPAMMPLIRLAKGIITDEGGITSHAAIVSRELGIPSIIGTIHATRVFVDGDRVELDADNGKVRKL